MAQSKKRKAPARAAKGPVIVPDTSVIIDGRLTMRIERNELKDATILIPLAVVSELEYQANQGRESGFNGLDEVMKIQELKEAANLEVRFEGRRPTPDEIELAAAGELDALIRDVAFENDATLLTADRVQSHVARAMGIDVEYVRPEVEEDLEISELGLTQYFDDDTMSVHLKQGVVPYAKKGTPGNLTLTRIGRTPLELGDLTRMSREIIEAARRDPDSFVEIERLGATVVQLGPIRVSITRPPFSDAIEITAVRPVVHKTLEEYELPSDLRERLQSYQRGVFVSGPPGSGKSTFVAAVAGWLHEQDTIVKTMESPRDLQVPDEVTQYAPLERSMELTSDVLLLVRPDFVVYDEVRKTEDFEIFADMRLAGVGLIGVTHANRAIDAVQRLIGRVELGMIPQVVDTVVHIEKGRVQQILQLAFTVKVPAGMQEADLARPVIEVKDFETGKVTHEIYTYGEQVVVMPLGKTEGGGGVEERGTRRDELAERGLRQVLKGIVRGPFEVEFTGGNSITLYAKESEIPKIIGRGGSEVQALERELGLRIDVRALKEAGGKVREPRNVQSGGNAASGRRAAELIPDVRKTKKAIVLSMDRGLAGQEVDVAVDGESLFTATVSGRGDIRLNRKSDEGDDLLDALARGAVVTIQV